MTETAKVFSPEVLWTVFGVIGGVIWYGRFYVQWLVSEVKKKSVMPVAFWYMSGAGSLMQFVYAVHLSSPGAAFGLCFNILVYTRNLVHVWRERGQLTKALNIGAHTLAILIVAAAMAFTALTWQREVEITRDLPVEEAARNWFWIGVWGVGQALFFLRFFIQWLATEIKKKSVVPTAFWHLSVIAAVLQSAHFFQRGDWIFAVGMALTVLIYSRNLMLIYRRRNETAPGDEA